LPQPTSGQTPSDQPDKQHKPVVPSDANTTADHLTVRDLRRRWKPTKERLANLNPHHPTNIRFHRACSWIQRTETAHPTDDLDLTLCFAWIGFNALYGQWVSDTNEPASDRYSWQTFLKRMSELDKKNKIAAVLKEHKKLVLTILDDAYLGKYFWRDPSPERARQTTPAKRNAPRFYEAKNWIEILESLMDRIYFLRCQIVHGASTHNSKENRKTARHCTLMLEHLLQAILLIWIDHGSDEDWGPLCYPPQG